MIKLGLFLFGLAIGSFVNVLAVRYKDGGTIFSSDILRGRSHCPKCKKTLRWYELIPLLSFIFQLGRCRDCGKPISLQYPVVEIISGMIVLLTPIYLPAAPIWILIFESLLLMTLIDLRLYVIPDQLNIFLVVLGGALIFYNWPVVWTDIGSHLIGGLIGTLVIGIIVVASNGAGMGVGDWKLIAGLGLIIGWPKIVVLLGSAFIFGGLWGIILLLAGRKKFSDALPFGPFLAAGLLTAVIFGDWVLQFYL